MDLIGTGLYPLKQAARLVGANPRSVQRWMLGYKRKHLGQSTSSGPLWRTQYESDDLPDHAIGFLDLMELRMIAAFVRHGVSLQVIKATADAARISFGSDYPLTNKKFLTDGRRIFLEALEKSGEEKLVDVLKQQYVLRDIIHPSLHAGVEYADEVASRWFPLGGKNRQVVLDPAVQFGSPVVTEVGIPTDTIYAAFIAEDRDKRTVAKIYNITSKQVDAAVAFEVKLAA